MRRLHYRQRCKTGKHRGEILRQQWVGCGCGWWASGGAQYVERAEELHVRGSGKLGPCPEARP